MVPGTLLVPIRNNEDWFFFQESSYQRNLCTFTNNIRTLLTFARIEAFPKFSMFFFIYLTHVIQNDSFCHIRDHRAKKDVPAQVELGICSNRCKTYLFSP